VAHAKRGLQLRSLKSIWSPVANPIQISVYEDNVIIWNTATIPEELPIETLLGKHPSIPYNPLLAAAFFRARYIEAWGRGIEKIETACEIADTKMPEITYKFGGVLVTFTGDVMGKGLDGGSVGSDGEADSREETTRATVEKTVEKIVRLLHEKPEITTIELAEELGISLKGVAWQLSKLKSEKRVRRIGPDKGGHWEVVDPHN
jgi:ATP-dependent DNA helicase RecG